MFQQNPTFTRAMKMTQGAMMENDSNCTSLPSVSRVNQRSLLMSLLVQMYYFYRAMGKIVYIYQFPLRPPRKRCTSQKAKIIIFQLGSLQKGGKPEKKNTPFFSWYLWGSGICFIHAPEGKNESNQRSQWCFGSDADFPFHFGGPVCFRSPGLHAQPPPKGEADKKPPPGGEAIDSSF